MQNTKILILVDRIKFHKFRLMISAIWILGLVIGKGFAQNNPLQTITADAVSHSILPYPNAALNILLTMLIGCIACIISHRLLYIFLFCKAFIFALVTVNITAAFGDAGWLLRILLLSSDAMLIAFLLLFSLKSAGKTFETIARNAAITVIATAVLISVDLHFIIPFAASLLNS